MHQAVVMRRSQRILKIVARFEPNHVISTKGKIISFHVYSRREGINKLIACMYKHWTISLFK